MTARVCVVFLGFVLGVAGDEVLGATLAPQAHRDQVDYHGMAEDNAGLESTAAGSHFVGVLQEEAYTFILAGQSNASGRGALDENNETSDPRVLLFGNDYQWKIAYEPMDDPAGQLDSVSDDSGVMSESRGHSFALRAAKELLGSGTQMIHVIPCPKGGSSISQWRRGGDPFDRTTLFGSCNYRRLVASPEGVATALWWYQGESEKSRPATFAASHTALIGEFREEMGAFLPVVYVQLAKHLDPALNTASHVIGEIQRHLESGSGHALALSNHYMVVTFDLPMAYTAHIDQAAQKELGRRVGLATRQHILGEQVDGTGPRLLTHQPLIHPGGDRSRVLVRFDRPINDTTNSYEGQFRLFDDTAEVLPASVQRAPSDDSAVLIVLPSAVSGTAGVSYGDVPVAGAGISLPGVIKGANDLPAPRFGPLDVEMEASRIGGWQSY